MMKERAVLLITSMVLGSLCATAQNRVNIHNLESQVKLFDDYSKDFTAMEQPTHGEEFDALNFYQGVAAMAENRMDAANTELKMYDLLSSPADKRIIRPIIIERMKEFSWLFDSEITRAAGALKFLTAPAEAQEAVRLKDDLRTAKERFDMYATSLQ